MNEDEIIKIIFRQLLCKVTVEERKRLEAWQEGNEERRRLVEQLTSTPFIQEAILDENSYAHTRVWKAIREQTLTKKRRMIARKWLKVAAAVMLPILFAWAVWLLQGEDMSGDVSEIAGSLPSGNAKVIVELADGGQVFLENDTVVNMEGAKLVSLKDTLSLSGDKEKKTGYHVIRIPRGGEYILKLDDGTVVYINSASELKVPVAFCAGIPREVWLKGEAYFDVAHDEERKFTVHTSRFDIQVTGTQFNVRSYVDEIPSAVLAEGSIRLECNEKSVSLVPGQQASLVNGQVEVREVNLQDAIAWRYNTFSFKQQALEELLNELARWYDLEIIYMNPALKKLHFTAGFKRSCTLDEVVEVLERTKKIRLEVSYKTLIVKEYK